MKKKIYELEFFNIKDPTFSDNFTEGSRLLIRNIKCQS